MYYKSRKRSTPLQPDVAHSKKLSARTVLLIAAALCMLVIVLFISSILKTGQLRKSIPVHRVTATSGGIMPIPYDDLQTNVRWLQEYLEEVKEQRYKPGIITISQLQLNAIERILREFSETPERQLP